MPLPARKKKLSFAKQQEVMAQSETHLQEQLKSFKQWCIRNCWSWLTVQMLLYCRGIYVLQPDYNNRRRWLEAEYARLKSNTDCYCYNIDMLGQERKVCCMETWLFAYWIPKATHKRYRNKGGFSTNAKKVKGKFKAASFGCQAATLFFVVWLLQFACKVGDKLPFGDSSVNKTEIRLPYPSKSMVYDISKNFVKEKDVTSTDKLISLSLAACV